MTSYSDIVALLSDPIVSTGILAVVGAVVTRVLLRNHPTRRQWTALRTEMARLSGAMILVGGAKFEGGSDCPKADSLDVG
ncbi:hypothetical protein [Bosea sp. BIWAKO-01]|uniref:hypothetical protein n=1 Tax=Bosea sp. BIWAKO-01 TaxID=506668 RepID=UPI0008531D18|nr:hypothetical protein [Bosea sp. BIWAKO-01]GAU85642.1 hypothetical protein BIWAKO_05590 [Bosea sp. BIWAKO-01]